MGAGTLRWYALAVIGVFLWSFNVIVSRYLLGILLPWQIAFFRWLLAALILIPFTWKDIWAYRQVYKRHLIWVLQLSLFGIALSNTFVYIAGYTITAVEMSLIQVTGPLFLIIFSRLGGLIRMSKTQVIGLFLTLFGVFTIILHGRYRDIGQLHLQIGDFWMLMTAVTFGYYSFLMVKKPKELNQMSLLSVTVLIGAVMTLPLFIYDTVQNPLTSQNVTVTTGLIMVYMGLFNSVLAYLAWNTALNHLDSVRVGMVYYTMPVFSTIAAYFILHEQIYLAQLWGGLLIVMGIYLANKRVKKHLFMERP
ncbi:MAG: DMT family transporter [Alphaproteobacteria bacterium]